MDSAVKQRTPELEVLERVLAGFASGDEGVVDELCSPDLIEHQFGMDGTGAEAIAKVKKAIADLHRGIPDLSFELEDWAQHGDTVWARVIGTGTNTGPFMGPATGLPIRVTVIDVARVRDGRIVEHWGVPDRFAILAQLGRLGPKD